MSTNKLLKFLKNKLQQIMPDVLKSPVTEYPDTAVHVDLFPAYSYGY